MFPDPDKTCKVQGFPVPKDGHNVRQFLGLASYYRRFVPGFAVPLHKLLRKDAQFCWSAECQGVFDSLRKYQVTAPDFAYPRFGPGEELFLETDASLEGLGAVLGQRQPNGHVHPLAYASRSLHTHKHNYSIMELETLALVWAVKHFRPYLLGHCTTVLTGHVACTSLLNTSKPSAKLAQWAMIVQEFDLIIKHQSGKNNANADALSRNPIRSDKHPSSVLTVQSDEVELVSHTEEL